MQHATQKIPESANSRHCPKLAADAVVIKNNQILLITRGKEPQKGTFAFPGGHVDYGEDPLEGVLRELEEECGIKGKNPQLIDVRGKPERDPRYHIVSIFYRVDVDDNAEPQFGDDAASAKFYSVSDILKFTKDQFYGDHYEALQTVISKYNLQ